mmetsp:Transcript_35443/g.47575  ORF Transcript_35443/g.47575 Transcript_35443/m.47575 type:complete len:437 (+) Transcript_35443:112-1422(+)
MTVQPNETQQRAIAYAIKPLAILSFLSASYVVYHLLVQKREKLKRMYHRIILGINIYVLPYAITDFVGTWAMPVGTPYRVGAAGNQGTCIAQGFIQIICAAAVPYYYSSLSVFSCFAVRNSFKEENYRHIEKWIHLGAIFVTLPIAIMFATRESINPGISVCYLAEYPNGCVDDPNVPCERGGDSLTSSIETIYGAAFAIITFIIPPAALLYLQGIIKSGTRDTNRSVGKKKLIESLRKRALKNLTAQSGLYLLSFWSTQALGYISFGYHLITGKWSYSLAIAGICCSSFQGVVLMLVYFRLEAKEDAVAVCDLPEGETEDGQRAKANAKVTVADIREAAKNTKPRSWRSSLSSSRRYPFNIFDGQVDESSPWAKFLNPDSDSEDDLDINLEDVGENKLKDNPDDGVSKDGFENDTASYPNVTEDPASEINYNGPV